MKRLFRYILVTFLGCTLSVMLGCKPQAKKNRPVVKSVTKKAESQTPSQNSTKRKNSLYKSMSKEEKRLEISAFFNAKNEKTGQPKKSTKFLNPKIEIDLDRREYRFAVDIQSEPGVVSTLSMKGGIDKSGNSVLQTEQGGSSFSYKAYSVCLDWPCCIKSFVNLFHGPRFSKKEQFVTPDFFIQGEKVPYEKLHKKYCSKESALDKEETLSEEEIQDLKVDSRPEESEFQTDIEKEDEEDHVHSGNSEIVGPSFQEIFNIENDRVLVERVQSEEIQQNGPDTAVDKKEAGAIVETEKSVTEETVDIPLPVKKGKQWDEGLKEREVVSQKELAPNLTDSEGFLENEDRPLKAFKLNLKNGGHAEGRSSSGRVVGSSYLPVLGKGYEYVNRTYCRHNYGTGLAVDAIRFLGRWVSRMFGGRLLVISIARKGGGRLAFCSDKGKKKQRVHKSHQNGLDIDVGYIKGQEALGSFVFNQKNPSRSKIRIQGRDQDFDFEANFQFYKAMVTKNIVYRDRSKATKRSLVDKILVNHEVKRAFCHWVKERARKENRKVTQVEKNVLEKMYGFWNHRDHAHIRFHCSPHYKGCSLPMYCPREGDCNKAIYEGWYPNILNAKKLGEKRRSYREEIQKQFAHQKCL